MTTLVILWLLFGTVVAALAVSTTGLDSIADSLGSLIIGLSGAIVCGLAFMRFLAPAASTTSADAAFRLAVVAFVAAGFGACLLFRMPRQER